MFGRLMPREGRFFDLFNEHAEQLLLGAHELAALMSIGDDIERRAYNIESIEKRGDKIAHTAIELLHRTFITPLDRDDPPVGQDALGDDRPAERLRELGWELPRNFMGLDEDAADFARARSVILPVPYESTTSYGGGTSQGPRAILEASRYIELYDQELDSEPWESGIATLPSLQLTGAGPEEAGISGTYTLETIIQAGHKGMAIVSVPIHSGVASSPTISAGSSRRRWCCSF